MGIKKHIISKKFVRSVLLAAIAMFSYAGGLSLVSTAKAEELEEPAPFGINNPFKIGDIDKGSVRCLSDKATLTEHNSYVENHISVEDIKECAPTAVKYEEAMRDVGVNVISQHFRRNYTDSSDSFLDVKPKFGNDHETTVQLYINGYDNYFWAAINPVSEKYFPGDIKIIDAKNSYLPNSVEGFAEWRKWLTALFDYLDDHQATDKLAYIQLGNESDSDYEKKKGANPANPNDYHWLAYARLVEESYKIIKARAPQAKIISGGIGAGSVAIDGFYRPALNYLAGKVYVNGGPVNKNGLCGGTGCFDAFDYHDFSEHKEVGARVTVSSGLTIIKRPATFRELLDESGFNDKGLVVQQGGTYTGYDKKEKKMKDYQTEEDQASFLVNRAIALIAQGVEAIQFGTYIEHYGYKGVIHNWFTLMGLVFNGIPKDTCGGQFPCPDPGEGIKKLSWFSQKKLNETLKDSDWKDVKTLDTGVANTFAYKFVKKTDAGSDTNSVYALSWHWWEDCPRDEDIVEQYKESIYNHVLMDRLVNESNKDCLNRHQPTVTIGVSDNISEIKITEAVPDFTTGQEADDVGYENAFKSYTVSAVNGKAEILLGQKPLYIEDLTSPGLRVSRELPFGLSNPYEEGNEEALKSLPKNLEDLGLSQDDNGAGFVVDSIARKNAEVNCGDAAGCRAAGAGRQYDFSQAKELIDLVVGQGKTNLWIVIGSPSDCEFSDGKERKDGKTYLPDGPISRQAYKDYLTALVNYVTAYGRQVSGDPDWHVALWNLYNEVNAEYRDTFDHDIGKATTAYVNFVIDSAQVLRKLSPQSKIVLAGAGSGTDLAGKQGDFYRRVFAKLKSSHLRYEPFDYWESHWFGESKDYSKNEAGYGVKDFIAFLKANGYGDKEFLIRAGATYSGQDKKERNRLMNNYQSERDQSKFLIKRFIYNLAAGARKIPWSTVYEQKKYQGELHVSFNYMGLIYNGVTPPHSLPAPDPGLGVKKLSYYTFKQLIEKLKGSDFDKIETIKDGSSRDNLYLYKFNKQGKPIWVVWNDNNTEKQIVISGINASQVKITEAVPKYKSGKDGTDYNHAFNTETKLVSSGGKITITLKDSPVFVEEK